MLRLLADENFNGYIVRGLLRRRPDLALIRIQEVGMATADDPAVLDWAAVHNRILLTHDRATMPDYAYQRVVTGQAMPGVFVVSDRLSLQQVIEEILFLDEYSEQNEWRSSIIYLPL